MIEKRTRLATEAEFGSRRIRFNPMPLCRYKLESERLEDLLDVLVIFKQPYHSIVCQVLDLQLGALLKVLFGY